MEEGAPRKKVKINQEQPNLVVAPRKLQISDGQPLDKEIKTTKISQKTQLSAAKEVKQSQNSAKTVYVDWAASENGGRRELRLADQQEDGTKQTQKSNRQITKNSLIRDLWQQKVGWVLECRVKYLNTVQCSNGLFASNFVIEDEVGDQMRCVYFNAIQPQSILSVGCYYLLAFGEVKASESKDLHIIFDRTSLVLERKDVVFSVLQSKVKRISDLGLEEAGAFVSVLGVVRKIKCREKFKAKIKYTATLSDPLRKQQIDFMLFLNPSESVAEGMVVVLYNFQIGRQGSITRLNSTFKSYFYEERDEGEGTVHEMYVRIREEQWEREPIRNISAVQFAQRTIVGLRGMVEQTEDTKLFSEIDCWVLEVLKKRAYQACKKCKKVTEKREMGLYECTACRRTVDIVLTYALTVAFTDFSGSMEIDVIAEQAEKLLQKTTLEFHLMTPQHQNIHLDNLRYRNVFLKLKTEKKDTRVIYSIWDIVDSPHTLSLLKARKFLRSET